MRVRKFLSAVLATVVLSLGLPVLAWSHPGHGLDGLWVHDLLHAATAVLVVALSVLLVVRFVRNRKQNGRD